jgi:Flp pilus assembly pilin Flp
MVGLIALVIVASVTTFGLAVAALFDVPCPLSGPCP